MFSIALQTYVAITQAIKEVRTGGICSNRVDYGVSDHFVEIIETIIYLEVI